MFSLGFIFNDTEQMFACECVHFREEEKEEKKTSQRDVKLSIRK